MTTVMNGCEICWRYYFCGRFMWVGCHLKNQFEGILDSIVGPKIFLPPFMGSILRPSVACGACGFQAIPFGTTVEKLWAGGPPSMYISTFNLFNLTVFMHGWHPGFVKYPPSVYLIPYVPHDQSPSERVMWNRFQQWINADCDHSHSYRGLKTHWCR